MTGAGMVLLLSISAIDDCSRRRDPVSWYLTYAWYLFELLVTCRLSAVHWHNPATYFVEGGPHMKLDLLVDT